MKIRENPSAAVDDLAGEYELSERSEFSYSPAVLGIEPPLIGFSVFSHGLRHERPSSAGEGAGAGRPGRAGLFSLAVQRRRIGGATQIRFSRAVSFSKSSGIRTVPGAKSETAMTSPGEHSPCPAAVRSAMRYCSGCGV